MMIDSEKLMGRMESKGTVLSEKSISNVGVIRRKLVDIDGMLKDKLVLAKVKEGIRRQEEERLKRVEREDGIEESDDDRDIDMDGEKSKRKKPKPGGPSSASNILGPVGAILAGGGLALIAKNLGTFRVTAQILKGIGSGALITFMGAATAINAGYKVVNAIETKTLQMFGDKGLQTLKQFQKVFSTFVNVAVVTAVTAGGASVLGKTRKGLFSGRFKRPKFESNEIAGISDLRTKKVVKPTSIVRSFRPQDIDYGLDDSDAGRVRFDTPEVIIDDIKKLRIAARENLTNQQSGRITDDVFDFRRKRISFGSINIHQNKRCNNTKN